MMLCYIITGGRGSGGGGREGGMERRVGEGGGKEGERVRGTETGKEGERSRDEGSEGGREGGNEMVKRNGRGIGKCWGREMRPRDR